MQKWMIALLALMLAITVIFTSFGVAYSRSDFMSTMLKVEHGLGDTSEKTLELYKKTKTFFGNLYESVNNIIDIHGVIDATFKTVSRSLSKVNACFSLGQKYGFSLDGKTVDAYSVLFRGFDYEPFWNQNEFNIDDALKVVGCLVYDEENEYYYSFYKALHWFDSSTQPIVNYGLFHHVSDYDSLKPADSFGWFTAPSLAKPEISDSLVAHFMTDKMIADLTYDGLQLPITSTNIKYSFNGSKVKPIAIKLRRSASHRGLSDNVGISNMRLVGNPELCVMIGSVKMYIDFVFIDESSTTDFYDTLCGGEVLHDLYYTDIAVPDSDKSWLENQIYYWKNLMNRFGDYYAKAFGAGAHMGGRDF